MERKSFRDSLHRSSSSSSSDVTHWNTHTFTYTLVMGWAWEVKTGCFHTTDTSRIVIVSIIIFHYA